MAILQTTFAHLTLPRNLPIFQLIDIISKIILETFLALIWGVYKQNFSPLALKLSIHPPSLARAANATTMTRKAAAIQQTNTCGQKVVHLPGKISIFQPPDKILKLSLVTFL